MNPLPRLRPVEIVSIPAENDETAYILRDPEGYAAEEIALSHLGLFLAAHFDGQTTMDGLLERVTERYGSAPPAERVLELVDRFDSVFFLENETFDAHRERLHAAFLAEPHRLPAHAGVSYPEEQGEAAAALATFWEAAASIVEPGERPSGTLRGIIAPHIDLRVGGACTAAAYRVLEEAREVDTVIVLGTSHTCPRPEWIVLEKPFDTPLGTVPVDMELAARLRDASTADPEDIFFHRREHSLEFQAVFLAALRAAGRDIRMVPVLCGSLRRILVDKEGNHHEDPSPPPNREDTPFLAELQRVLEEYGDRAIVLAGADMAHVGPRFGDEEALTARHLELLETRDRATLTLACGADAQGFYEHVVDKGDPRRICGLSPVYGMLTTMRPARGKLLRYEQANDDTGTVSYASVGFWG